MDYSRNAIPCARIVEMKKGRKATEGWQRSLLLQTESLMEISKGSARALTGQAQVVPVVLDFKNKKNCAANV
jgi:hypothetical protein